MAPLPRVQVFATYVDESGAGLPGTVTFQPTFGRVLDTVDLETIEDKPVTVTLDSAGAANLSLMATDSDLTSGITWYYEVTEKIDGQTSYYKIELKFSDGAVQNLASIPHLGWDGN